MKLVALLSDGIDSPVAVYLMCRAGAEVILLNMDNGVFSSQAAKDKVRLLAERLRQETGQELPLYSADHGSSLSAFAEKCEEGYRCILCKRAMLGSARIFADEHGADGILMGDSLGQVASQTLSNIRSEQHGLGFPVIRPLIGLDKQEIIDIAQRIGTYDLSIMRTDGCGAVPKHPMTEAGVHRTREQQERVDFGSLIRHTADSAARIQ
ncbi:MAG: tRNA 4-thiouridine(8) synthase ThiI [Candidatus Methanomethylophilaceae archaeon]|jgi:thiamine biosynthesis protein ThiI|nr:tRNA 4-thiouridine(8) synthase ThiI [Candidatus Methanomethylophilaceae archaeon]